MCRYIRSASSDTNEAKYTPPLLWSSELIVDVMACGIKGVDASGTTVELLLLLLLLLLPLLLFVLFVLLLLLLLLLLLESNARRCAW
jgi:hypothetical protein